MPAAIAPWEVKNNSVGENAGCIKTNKFIIFCYNGKRIKIIFFPAHVLNKLLRLANCSQIATILDKLFGTK